MNLNYFYHSKRNPKVNAYADEFDVILQVGSGLPKHHITQDNYIQFLHLI